MDEEKERVVVVDGESLGGGGRAWADGRTWVPAGEEGGISA